MVIVTATTASKMTTDMERTKLTVNQMQSVLPGCKKIGTLSRGLVKNSIVLFSPCPQKNFHEQRCSWNTRTLPVFILMDSIVRIVIQSPSNRWDTMSPHEPGLSSSLSVEGRSQFRNCTPAVHSKEEQQTASNDQDRETTDDLQYSRDHSLISASS